MILRFRCRRCVCRVSQPGMTAGGRGTVEFEIETENIDVVSCPFCGRTVIAQVPQGHGPLDVEKLVDDFKEGFLGK